MSRRILFLLLGVISLTVRAEADLEISPSQIEKLKSEIKERSRSHENPVASEIPAESRPETTEAAPSDTRRKLGLGMIDAEQLPPLAKDRLWSFPFSTPWREDSGLQFPEPSPRFDAPNEDAVALSRLSNQQDIALSAGTLTTGSLVGNYANENLDIKPLVAAQFDAGRGYQNNHGNFQNADAQVSFTRRFSSHDQARLGFAYLDNFSNEPDLHTSGQMAMGTRGFYSADAAPLGGSQTSYSIWTRYELLVNSDQKVELLPFARHAKNTLFHDESLFRIDPVHGDERERREEGNWFGLRAIYRRVDRDHTMAMATTIDGNVAIDNREFQLTATQNRTPLRTMLRADENRTAAGLNLKQEIAWNEWLMSKGDVGAQWTQLNFSPSSGPSQFPAGTRDEVMLNPLAELDVKLGKRSTFSMKTGVTHSVNEMGSLFSTARASSFSSKTTLYELSLETRAISRRLASSVGIFIAIDDPKFFLDDSDLGVVQIPSQKKVGFEIASRYQIYRPLYIKAGFTASRIKASPKQGPFDSFSFEPNRRLKVGLEVEPTAGFYGGAGVSHLSQQLALDDSGLSVPGWWRLDAELGYRTKGFDFQLAFFNLTGAEIWQNPIARVTRTAQNTSVNTCGSGASPVVNNGQFVGCEQVLFTPAPPFAMTASARATF